MEETRRVVMMRPGYAYVPPQKFDCTILWKRHWKKEPYFQS